MPEGTVRWFDAERGFGFLAPEDGATDLFVHASEIVGDGGARCSARARPSSSRSARATAGPQALRVRVTADAAPDAPWACSAPSPGTSRARATASSSPDGGGAEVFVHSSAIVTGGVVAAGQRVAFLVAEGERGPQAGARAPAGCGRLPRPRRRSGRPRTAPTAR